MVRLRHLFIRRIFTAGKKKLLVSWGPPSGAAPTSLSGLSRQSARIYLRHEYSLTDRLDRDDGREIIARSILIPEMPPTAREQAPETSSHVSGVVLDAADGE